MRKTSKITLVALLALALVATLCACGLLSGATALTIESMPRTSYTTEDQNYDWTGFTLRVYTNTKKDDTYKQDGNNDRWYKDFSYDDLMKEGSKDFSVTSFAKGQVGTHTAQIRYLGLSVSFNYTVSESLFAGGEGTKANPYQISTAEQFERIGSRESTTYFVLINDIDLENYNTVGLIKNAEIDGNGYALRNLKKFIANNFEASSLKNVNIYMNSKYALFEELGNRDRALALIENVNVYGVMDRSEDGAQNIGIIAFYVSTQLCRIKNVNVYADLFSNTDYGAVFIGYTNYCGGDLYFENTRFYGYAQGRELAIFTGNTQAGGKDVRTIHIDNLSGNYGSIVTTDRQPAGVRIPLNDDQAAAFAEHSYITVEVDGEVKIDNETNFNYFNKTGSVAKRVYDKGLTLTVDDNNKFVVNYNGEKSNLSFRIIATIWTYEATDETRQNKIYTSTWTLLATEKFNATGVTDIYCADWVLDTELTDEAGYKYDEVSKQYKFLDSKLFGGKFICTNLGSGYSNGTFKVSTPKNRALAVRYTLYAYENGNKLIGSYTYGITTYPEA